MRIGKKIFSLVLLAIFVFIFVACSSTKKACPAYSKVIRETSAVHTG
jgi:hypothetical protein